MCVGVSRTCCCGRTGFRWCYIALISVGNVPTFAFCHQVISGVSWACCHWQELAPPVCVPVGLSHPPWVSCFLLAQIAVVLQSSWVQMESRCGVSQVILYSGETCLPICCTVTEAKMTAETYSLVVVFEYVPLWPRSTLDAGCAGCLLFTGCFVL